MPTLPDRLVLALVRLYPRSWRMRYEAEFRALVADTPVGWRKVVDVARAIGPEWGRVIRAAFIDIVMWRAIVRYVARVFVTGSIAVLVSSAAEFLLRLNTEYTASVWFANVVDPAKRKVADAEAAQFAWMVSPDRHEIALSYQYTGISAASNPNHEVLIRPCCNLRWVLNSELRALPGIVESRSVFGWFAFLGCAPFVLLFRLTGASRTYPRLGRLFVMLLFLEVVHGWPWLTTSMHLSLWFQTLPNALEGAILATALFPLVERPSGARSSALVSA